MSLATLVFIYSIVYSVNRVRGEGIIVSSAYIFTFEDLSDRSRSFIYSRKSNGPRHDPCGTQYLTSSKQDTCPLTLQHCLRFLRYDEDQRYSLPCMS